MRVYAAHCTRSSQHGCAQSERLEQLANRLRCCALRCHPLCPFPAADFIRASPLLPSCGISGEQVEAELGRWAELGAQVARNLGFPPIDRLEPSQRWGLQPLGMQGMCQLKCELASILTMPLHAATTGFGR